MTRSKYVLVAAIAAAIGTGTLQIVRAASDRSINPNSVRNLDDDKYPHMRKALHDLRAAKDSLLDAEPRFKGHRDKAIEQVNTAIKQCEDALAEG
jgi:hypothetical protein